MDMEVVQFCCCLLSPHRIQYQELRSVKSQHGCLSLRQFARRWSLIWNTARKKTEVNMLACSVVLLREYRKASKDSAYPIQATKSAILEEFQPFWEELSSLLASIDYSKLCLLTSSCSAKSIMNEFIKLSAPLRLPEIVLQIFSEGIERAGLV